MFLDPAGGKDMAYAEATVVINEKIDKIFDFILDGRNNKLWRPRVKSVEYDSLEKIGVGSVFIQEMQGPPNKKIDADYKIIECEKYQRISFHILNGPYTPTGRFIFEQLDEGVKVTFSMSELEDENPEKDTHFQKVVDDIINIGEINFEETIIVR